MPALYQPYPSDVDYGRRRVGAAGVLGVEGRDASNLIDPTPFMQGQSRFGEQFGQMFSQQHPLSLAVQGAMLNRAQGLDATNRFLANQALGQADMVAGLAPGALESARGAAGRMSSLADAAALYGPQAVQAAQQAAGGINALADATAQYGPQAVQAAQQAALGMQGQARDLRGFTDPAAQALGQFGAQQTGLYGTHFQPIEQQIAQFAQDYDNESRRAAEMGRARADVAREFGRQRDINERRLASMGVDPSMGRGRSLQFDLAEAAARAGASENARRAVEQQGIALRAQAAGLGGQIAGRGTAATQAGAQLGAAGAGQAANILQGAGALQQQGLATGSNILGQAAGMRGAAGGLQQQGLATGANILNQAAGTQGAAGGLAQQGTQLAGNLGLGAGGLYGQTAGRLGQGATAASNIQTAGLQSGQAATPLLNAAQAANLANVGIASDWNRGIWSTQGNRMSGPSALTGALTGLAGAGGQFLGSYVGNRYGGGGGGGGGFIPGLSQSWEIAADGGQVRGYNDGGYLYSTRQRFADGGGLLPAGIPASAWVQNAPVPPPVARADGGPAVEKGCQRIGNQAVMPDGSPCKVVLEGMPQMADGGRFVAALKAAAPVAATSAVVGAVERGSEQPKPQGQAEPIAASTPPQGAAQPASPALPAAADGSGGVVTGPGDGTGIDDRVPALLSTEEYVVPADVVRAKGTEFFDKLKERYHTPAAIQRQQMGAV